MRSERQAGVTGGRPWPWGQPWSLHLRGEAAGSLCGVSGREKPSLLQAFNRSLGPLGGNGLQLGEGATGEAG